MIRGLFLVYSLTVSIYVPQVTRWLKNAPKTRKLYWQFNGSADNLTRYPCVRLMYTSVHIRRKMPYHDPVQHA